MCWLSAVCHSTFLCYLFNTALNKYTIVYIDLKSSASPTTELSTSVDNSFGIASMPSVVMPTSRLSLNGNALGLAVSKTNPQTMRHSLHSSKSNDTIHSHDLATITSNRAFQHFNIDEYYVPRDERNNVMGKLRKMIPRHHPTIKNNNNNHHHNNKINKQTFLNTYIVHPLTLIQNTPKSCIKHMHLTT